MTATPFTNFAKLSAETLRIRPYVPADLLATFDQITAAGLTDAIRLEAASPESERVYGFPTVIEGGRDAS